MVEESVEESVLIKNLGSKEILKPKEESAKLDKVEIEKPKLEGFKVLGKVDLEKDKKKEKEKEKEKENEMYHGREREDRNERKRESLSQKELEKMECYEIKKGDTLWGISRRYRVSNIT